MSIAVALSSEDKTLNITGIVWFKTVKFTRIHVYLQFKSGYKENYFALTSLRIPLMDTIVHDIARPPTSH